MIALATQEDVYAKVISNISEVKARGAYVVLVSMDEEVTGFESALALDGGQDGLDLFRQILPIGLRMLGSGGVIALELHETCLEQALEEAVRAGYCNARIARDLAGRQRVLIAQKG